MVRHHHIRIQPGIILGLLFVLASITINSDTVLAAQHEVETVVREGDHAPDTPEGTMFSSFLPASINNARDVMFNAALTGAGVTSDNDRGIWSGPAGGLQLVAREGDQAPGTPAGIVFASLSGERLNQQGQVVFGGKLAGPGVTTDNDGGIWAGVPGALQLVAREGDPAPGTTNGETFELIYSEGGRPRIGANGHVVFIAKMAGPGVTSANDHGIWAGAPGSLQLVARQGDQAPGAPAGTVYSFNIGLQVVSINGNGEVAFNSGLSGGGTTGWGIWAGAPGNLTVVAQTGDQAPGTPAGVQFGSYLRPPMINDTGVVAFGSFLTGNGVTSANDRGIWAGVPGNLQLVIRQGDPAPGTFGGETVDLGAFPGPSNLNANGLVALAPDVLLAGNTVTPDNDEGIWVGPAGGLQLIAREGDPAPGTIGDTVLQFFVPRFATNAAGNVLFNSNLTGSQIPPGESGLWLGSQTGTEILIRSGDTIEIAPGEIRTVGSFGLPIAGGNQSGYLNSLNDLGQVVIHVRIPQTNEWAIIILSAGDETPIADAGDDQTVDEGILVTLDGSASMGPQNDPLNFTWTQVAGPTVELSLSDPVHPTFSAPYVNANATVTFELVVDDGIQVSDPDTVDITLVNVNNPPVADAGDDSTIKEGATAQLDGTYSYDPESDPINFHWEQVGGVPVTLLPSNTVAQPSFVAPLGIGQVLTFKLRVDDGREASTTSSGTDSSFDDTVAITVVQNSQPVADAGAGQTKDEGETITLQGSGSDPDIGDGLSFQWTQIAGPSVILNNTTSPTPSFEAPAVGSGGESFAFELVVTDDDPVNSISSIPDEVVITVRNINDPPSCDLAKANIDSLWPPNHKMPSVEINGVMDTDSIYNEITLTITGVTQDEPLNGTGDGDSSPDAVIQTGNPRDTVLLRSERAGNGDGRVYEVSFIASDGFESCGGSVRVNVPSSRKSTAIDNGQSFDSTVP